MTTVEWIDSLSILVLGLFVVALVYLIVLLHRANRIIGRLDNLGETFRSFVADIVPAIVNVGTIATALHSVLKVLAQRHHLPETKRSKKS